MLKNLLIKMLLSQVKDEGQEQKNKSHPVSNDLNKIMEDLQSILGNSFDVVYRKILVADRTKPALVVYLENMVDLRTVNEGVITRLQEASLEDITNPKVLAYSALGASKVNITSNLDKLIERVLYGDTAIFISGLSQALVAGTTGFEKRSISTPEIEVNVEGPKDSFVETLGVNITLIRRRLRNPDLRFEKMSIGTRTKTTVALAYIDGLADPSIVAEVKRRLDAIDTDSVMPMQMLTEYLTDNPLEFFPTILKGERPEQAVSCLLEGRFCILADGYPFCLSAPANFAIFMQAGDDYNLNFYFGSFVRWIRYASFLITLTLPSLWIALVTHHWEMMPTDLALSIAGSREGVPFPVFLEVLGMELTFEVLREAGVRLPRAVGQAVSIAGALVIGQSAVEAGLVSPGILIVVAFTGIVSFTLPKYIMSVPVRLLRFPLMLFTYLLGLPGLVAGFVMIWGYMASLTSFGVPYMAPFTPKQKKDLKDTIFRFPRWAMIHRPQSVPSMDPVRTDPIIPPGRGQKDE